MDRAMTIEEIKSQFESEWVLIGDPQTNDTLEILEGNVLHHSKDRDEVYRRRSPCVQNDLRWFIRVKSQKTRWLYCEFPIQSSNRFLELRGFVPSKREPAHAVPAGTAPVGAEGTPVEQALAMCLRQAGAYTQYITRRGLRG